MSRCDAITEDNEKMRRKSEEKYETYWRYWDTIGINTKDFDKQMEAVKIT